MVSQRFAEEMENIKGLRAYSVKRLAAMLGLKADNQETDIEFIKQISKLAADWPTMNQSQQDPYSNKFRTSGYVTYDMGSARSHLATRIGYIRKAAATINSIDDIYVTKEMISDMLTTNLNTAYSEA